MVGDAAQDAQGMASVDYWDCSPDAALAKIRDRLDTVEENWDFIVWLELTEKGREEARRLDEAGCNPFLGETMEPRDEPKRKET